MPVIKLVAAAGALAIVAAHGFAQVGEPVAAALPAPIAAPQDRPFNGSMMLSVTAIDTAHQIFHVHQTIPVQAPGPMVLLYPQWESGSHAPTASVRDLAGLVIRTRDGRLTWRRDAVDPHAFHVDLPAGATSIDLDFQFLADPRDAQLRPDMVVARWHRMLLYPAGWYVRNIPVAAQLRLPPGLRSFSSLEVDSIEGDTVVFRPVTLEALVDAPVYAARHSRQIDLATAGVPVRLDLLADAPADLQIPGGEISLLREMVAQAGIVFGRPPFDRYDALVSLSSVLSPGGGIEHLKQGENNLPAGYFSGPAQQLNNRDLIAHEYVHAWNGRFRQPADLWSPNFNLPVGGSLLWVYEGQTEFWGRVLAARSGMRSVQQTLDKLALDDALVANRKGRSWKSLADSGHDAMYMARQRVAWRDWQRRTDYYAEGVLLWLDVEARLRERSGGARGLDEFARRFFAAGTDAVTSTYTFEEVCAALQAVAGDNWNAILREHLDTHDDAVAMAGLARAGWELIYRDSPSQTFLQDEAAAGASNFDYSIGLQVDDSGSIRSVTWEGPAFRAGLGPGSRIKSVNGRGFTLALLRDAVNASASTPLVLGLDGQPGEVRIDYRGRLRYPALVRIAGVVDRLTPLLAARSNQRPAY